MGIQYFVCPFIFLKQLGFIHSLAFINNASLTIYVQILVYVYFHFSGKDNIELRMLCNMVILFLTLWGTAQLFYKVYNFTFPEEGKKRNILLNHLL